MKQYLGFISLWQKSSKVSNTCFHVLIAESGMISFRNLQYIIGKPPSCRKWNYACLYTILFDLSLYNIILLWFLAWRTRERGTIFVGKFCTSFWPSLFRNLTEHSFFCPQSTEISDCLLIDPPIIFQIIEWFLSNCQSCCLNGNLIRVALNLDKRYG